LLDPAIDMPYRTSADLPASVRDNLPDHAQTMFRNAFDAALHEAPAVIGHPEEDQSAHGWVKSLKREGETLLTKLKQISPRLAERIRPGTYKKRSISLYPDLVGKGLYLRHVGFLGAMPPVVKGLADIPGFKETGGTAAARLELDTGVYAEETPWSENRFMQDCHPPLSLPPTFTE
jgi:hypothetical protein